MDTNLKPATDKQIKYLNSQSAKLRRARSSYPKTFSMVERLEDIDWDEERRAGMTTIDASMKIEAFHSLFRGMNMLLVLCNKPQI